MKLHFCIFMDGGATVIPLIMKIFSRRDFLLQTVSLFAIPVIRNFSGSQMNQLHLSFSTLGCPDWDLMRIMDFASEHGYSGIELRGLQREMDLTKCKAFNNENRKDTLNRMKDKNLVFINLGSSAAMHHTDLNDRKRQMDDGRRFIDLAQQINCPYVRIFPDKFPPDREKNATMDLIIKGLVELGDHAKGSGVTVLMETHGDVVKSDDIEKIMNSADHQQVGIVWDFTNMWTITGEAPSGVYKKLKKYIRHTHIKDAKKMDGKLQYTLLGQGDVPVSEAIHALLQGGYKGYYSFEWEKLWHPELAEPETALADYPVAIKKYYN